MYSSREQANCRFDITGKCSHASGRCDCLTASRLGSTGAMICYQLNTKVVISRATACRP